jgi:chromate transporter
MSQGTRETRMVEENFPRTSSPKPIRELAALFTRLGFTAFGGPAAHVALMEDEIVTRRHWLDRQHFLDLVAAVNFVPGPNSTELAIHIGQLRGGLRGLIVAGACFIGPAMLIILPIAWAYVKWGATPQAGPALRGIAAAVAAIVAFATFRFAHTAIKDPLTAIIGALVAAHAIIAPFLHWPQPELPSLLFAAIVGGVWYRHKALSARLLAIPLGFWPELVRLGLVLLKIGATLFGSGYVLISYLQSEMVDHRGWLTQQQLSDAVAVGQFTPGPLLTTATFVGYLLGSTKFGGGMGGGILCGVAATCAIFLPAFVLVAIFGPLLQRIRQNPTARGALDGMNAAVVGLMLVIAMRMIWPAVYDSAGRRLNFIGVVILIGALLGLWRKVNTTWLIVAAGAIGWATRAIFGAAL